jgi:hypothetical protein
MDRNSSSHLINTCNKKWYRFCPLNLRAPAVDRRIIQVCVIVVLIFSGWTRPVLAATNRSVITPVSLLVSSAEVDKIVINFHEAPSQSAGEAAELTARGSLLFSSKKSILLSSAVTLLNSLHDLYPVPRPVTFLNRSDDYPYEQIIVKLKDGRQVAAESSSQFPKGVPWNIRVWQGQPDKSDLLGSYVLLNDDFHAGANEIWKALTGNDFPRAGSLDPFNRDSPGKANTLDFYVPEPNQPFNKYADRAPVSGLPAAALEPFIPVFKQNSELQILFDSGFTLFDAAFDVTVSEADRKPLWYSGMLALKAPGSADVVVTTVKIELGQSTPLVTSPLTAQAARAAIAQRQGFTYLENLTSFLPGFVFLEDLRSSAAPPDLTCAVNPAYGKSDFAVDGLAMGLNAKRVSLYHLPQQKAWTLITDFDRSAGVWDDSVVAQALARWFPRNFHQFILVDLESLKTTVGLAFRPEVTEQKPQLIPLLFQVFPDEATVHIANPVKEGDKSFASLEGELIIPENGHVPQMVYCGHQRLSGEAPPYDTASVKAPDSTASRDNLVPTISSAQDSWTPAFGLRSGVTGIQEITFVSGQAGYLHMLWTTDQPGKQGVYYAEGQADGMGWIRPQRLGDAASDVQAVSNTKGEIHLFWSTDGGSMHVWRNAQGVWQKSEYWQGIGHFLDILLDKSGNLHMAWVQSDGLDQEFFYSNWNQQSGLLRPENISRRSGDTGDNQIVLKENEAGQISAAWGHPLSGTQYIDPFSGETYDQVSIFYAQRYREGGWSAPEQIGVFAPFSYSLGLGFTAKNEPVVAWQSPQGIQASIRQNGRWARPALIQKLRPQGTPAVLGLERWNQVTAEIQVMRNSSSGRVTVVWSDPSQGIFTSQFTGKFWQAATNLISAPGLHGLNAQSGLAGALHVLYADEKNNLFYIKYVGKSKPVSSSLGLTADNSEISQLAVDEAGFVYVLGSPNSQTWKAYLPVGSSKLIHAPQTTSRPTATP